MASKITGEVSPAKRQRPGRHLVEHRAKGKQIGARVQFLASRLLGRHVGYGSDRGAGAGEQFFIHRYHPTRR